MSTLDSTSTWAAIKAAYYDNASYAEDASAAKAAAFATACRFLLLRIPKRSVHGGRGGEEIEFDPQVLREEMQAAQRYAAMNATSNAAGGVTHIDFSDFRT